MNGAVIYVVLVVCWFLFAFDQWLARRLPPDHWARRGTLVSGDPKKYLRRGIISITFLLLIGAAMAVGAVSVPGN
jgi:hypothetical protein